MELGNFELAFNKTSNNIVEFLVDSDSAYSTHTVGDGKAKVPQITRPILTKYELARLMYEYSNLLNSNIDTEFMNIKLNYENPILNTCDLIIKRIIPFILKRNILFDNKTYEVFNISEMFINDRDVLDIKKYILDNSIPLTDIDPTEILKLIKDG